MVKAEGSWLSPPHSTWQSPNFSCMSTPLEAAPLGCLPALNPGSCMVATNTALPGFALQSIACLKSQETNQPQRLSQCLPPHIQNLVANTGPYFKENLSVFPHGLGREAAQNEVPGLRRFVIFDQSGNETRLIYSSMYPPVLNPTVAATKPIQGHFHHEEYAVELDQVKPKLDEEIDESHLAGEESEMHEDTEEINALLYSDDDDYPEEEDDDDDEVTSTGHSPILVGGTYEMQEQVEEITDEVASSDGHNNKRQKLLDGGYKKVSVLDTASSVKAEGHCGYGDDAESSHAFGKTQERELSSAWVNKQFRKDKIRATLKILESIIPGAKDKDPMLVLDVAIDYLKSLKLKAKDLASGEQLPINFS
ncbi:hypothetical protein Tsubulata_024381 [Turnera subulata]|uniref:BHLH domain-containing protein n=1 Tax=Turnera subulata TaxID=218843 RepID=A0A9Q0JS85_9ROSI|nr:hypothetical protein Tsubulata_024381 [Turnera subulata]